MPPALPNPPHLPPSRVTPAPRLRLWGRGARFAMAKYSCSWDFSHSTKPLLHQSIWCCCSPFTNPTSSELHNIWKPFPAPFPGMDFRASKLLLRVEQKLPFLLLSLGILPSPCSSHKPFLSLSPGPEHPLPHLPPWTQSNATIEESCKENPPKKSQSHQCKKIHNLGKSCCKLSRGKTHGPCL